MPTPLEAVRRSLEPRKSLSDIAEEVGLKPATLWYWEHGKRIPKIETAERIAPAYGLSAEDYRDMCMTAKRMAERKSKAATAAS